MSRALGLALRTPNRIVLAGAFAAVAAILANPVAAFASELDLKIPALDTSYMLFGASVSGVTLLMAGLAVCVLGMIFGLSMFNQVKGMPAHKSMLDVSAIIYETCKAYLLQQGRLLMVLEVFIGACIVYYFGVLEHMGPGKVGLILMWSVVGILGSYSVAWFGIRMNTYANSRTAFASLRGKPLSVYEIPLQAGMSIGVLLICVELIMMLLILLFVPKEAAGASFLGFAIGESLGASALRIAGGIFTKIADIGSDLMKVVFKIKEDDPRNPGVIADCTGDNAGDSVGPTADGFETYGVTGVALISFIALAVFPEHKAHLLVWIFVMRILMIVTSIVAFSVNGAMARSQNRGKDKINFEDPLTSLVWMTSLLSIVVTFAVSRWMLADLGQGLWWKLSTIISCGTLAAALIPEFTKVFTSSQSRHVKEIVGATKEGGASLTILSGMVAGNFSVFWKALTLATMLLIAYVISLQGLSAFMDHAAVFAFGLVAFGLLGMGPVTIAVDSYGPVTDNAQSIFELSQVESLPGAGAEIEKQFGFKPDFVKGKHLLEDNDGAGNTFKATAKPVLIATAVAGATTMIFSLIVLLKGQMGAAFDLSLTEPRVLLGLLMGGATIYWFTGASMQAVTTGAYRAVEYIKRNIKLDSAEKASTKDSVEVVRICTQYAQKGMFNIFIVIFCLTLAYAFFDPIFFVAYLVSIAVVGLFQAVYMANAGGSWDNAKKVVEVELHEKGTPLHDATVIGDTVGDPYKDTSSVALNPIIKFTTLFGLLAVEMGVANQAIARPIGVVLMLVALVFVYRSFYSMRISSQQSA
ncbi:MAG: sodium-translocating pyrophosphatase [Candidatus Eisenbacteria bacterium]|uniref:K(+)-insensitive pyrophosphate-energized proton pump n=1 Tax=Eiseniibacteriota bacterium TaxID=2212470 RepID=A0A538UCY9_UNCEI|nr:MAG: sodium-translocating pyrophosphatase [Candidatus Eisenbacteria bacterium]